MHFIQSSLGMMYSGASLDILCNIGTTIATVSPFSWSAFHFSSLRAIHKGVDFIISASSAEVVSDSSFSFVCFCKGGITPPVPIVPVHYGLVIPDYRSALLPTLWLVPVTSFLDFHSPDAIAEVSPCDVVPSFCGSTISKPSSLGLLGTDAVSLSMVFILLFLALFLLVAQATIF